MRFEWDEEKARNNLAKHGVSFARAKEVFNDPEAIDGPDRVIDGEMRWRTIGRVDFVTVLFVAHTYVDADDEIVIRVISARKADKNERRAYERGNGDAIR